MNDTYIGPNSGFLCVADIAGHAKFFSEGLYLILELPSVATYTSDDIRVRALKQGIVAPHPKLWGSLIAKARAAGLLRNTGQMTPSRLPGGNARKVCVWERTTVSQCAVPGYIGEFAAEVLHV